MYKLFVSNNLDYFDYMLAKTDRLISEGTISLIKFILKTDP